MALQSQELQPGAATLSTQLPLSGRVGGRYISMDGRLRALRPRARRHLRRMGQRAGDAARSSSVPSSARSRTSRRSSLHGYNEHVRRARAAAPTTSRRATACCRVRAARTSIRRRRTSRTRASTSTRSRRSPARSASAIKHGAFGVDVGYAAVASIPRVVGAGQGDDPTGQRARRTGSRSTTTATRCPPSTRAPTEASRISSRSA